MKIEGFSKLVLDEPLVGIFDILGQVGKKSELRRWRRELHTVLDLDVFALVGRRRILTYNFLHGVVQLTRRDFLLSVLKDLNSRFNGFENSLLGQR